MFGLLNVNKPAGVTSRRVVDQVKRLVRPHKIGHAGTLDPLATGVLVIGIGAGTRLVEYVQEMPKRYRGTFLLGRTSDTEDIEGQVTELPDVPIPTREQLEQAALALTGEIMQRPPAYSALKVAGRRAYDLARQGQAVELTARPVHVAWIKIISYVYPELVLEIECSSGTYVRSLGRDLAERVGTGAIMSALVREAIGGFTLANAVQVEALSRENLPQHLLAPVLAIRGQMPEVTLTPEAAALIARGMPISLPEATEARCAALDAQGTLLAVLSRVSAEQFRAAKNLASG